jgi:nicotinate-nucleotide adenylyltransferase
MRLGIFGGTFDPPHIGHLLAASDAYEELGLDRLVIIPAAVQPLKVGTTTATSDRRLEMVRRMVAGDPRFAVDPVEIERDGLSYTVDTLELLARRHPEADRYLIVGGDVLSSFAKWREPRRILELATLAVVERQGERPGDLGADPIVARPSPSATSIRSQLESIVTTFGVDGTRQPVRLRGRRIDVSSTEVRDRVKAGRPIRGYVADAVADYIESHGLYR